MRKLFIAVAAISFIACSNDSDNDPGDAADTITVNRLQM